MFVVLFLVEIVSAFCAIFANVMAAKPRRFGRFGWLMFLMILIGVPNIFVIGMYQGKSLGSGLGLVRDILYYAWKDTQKQKGTK